MIPRPSGAVFDFRLWLLLLKSAAAGACLMTVMLPGLALLRDTAGHDWYAAGKVTLAQTLVASGFDRDAPMQYRTREGETGSRTRYRMSFTGEALYARALIVATALRHAVLGLPAGAVLGMLFVTLWPRGRAGEPPSEAWNGEDCVDGVLRLDGMEPLGVVVILPMDGTPAQVYGRAIASAALPGTQDKAADVAAAVNSTRALPVPAPDNGHTQSGQTKAGDPPNQPPERGKPKPERRGKRNYKRWI